MKIIEQKFTCTFCGVETTGHFKAETDEERIEQNKKENDEYLKKYNEYLNKISEYQKIVNTHNECEEKHKSLFYKPKFWELECDYDPYKRYFISGTNEYPIIVEEPKKPNKHYNDYIKYITCPVCGKRYYFR